MWYWDLLRERLWIAQGGEGSSYIKVTGVIVRNCEKNL